MADERLGSLPELLVGFVIIDSLCLEEHGLVDPTEFRRRDTRRLPLDGIL
ncbi:MAG TPA: hypothetical protein VIJ09_10935 [Acidimicrobiales bacterium]